MDRPITDSTIIIIIKLSKLERDHRSYLSSNLDCTYFIKASKHTERQTISSLKSRIPMLSVYFLLPFRRRLLFFSIT